MENIYKIPTFSGDFCRSDVSPLSEEEKIRVGSYRSKTMNEKRRKRSRYSFSFVRDHVILKDEFDINLVHINFFSQEDERGTWLFELLYGPYHKPIFIETRGTYSKLLRSMEGSGNYYGLHMNLEYHEPEFYDILEKLSSYDLAERLFFGTPIVREERLDYKISNCNLLDSDAHSGDIKVKLENSKLNFFTSAYDLAHYDNPNYNEAIRTYKNSDLVDNYKQSYRFNIKAIIHFSYITIINRKAYLIPFVKEFGYSRM